MPDPAKSAKPAAPVQIRGGASIFPRSTPVTWVTVKSPEMGDTSALWLRAIFRSGEAMTKAEQARLVGRRLKVLERAGDTPRSVAKTCRHFLISRKTFYKWKQRHATHGAACLGDRSRRPWASPRATSPTSFARFCTSGRRTTSGRAASPPTGCAFTARPLPSPTSRLESAPGQSEAPAAERRWQRYEKPQPGQRLQLDVKFLERIPGTN